MPKFFENLKTQAEENPFLAVVIGVATLSAASKFLDARGKASAQRTWDREVSRRERNTK